MSAKKEIYIYPAYASKHNLNREKKVIRLMISNGKKCKQLKTLAMRAKPKGSGANFDGCKTNCEGLWRWHYLAVKGYQHY